MLSIHITFILRNVPGLNKIITTGGKKRYGHKLQKILSENFIGHFARLNDEYFIHVFSKLRIG
jgi:hypothetical protein